MKIAVYTAAPWDSAVVVLRIIGPADFAGFEVLKGNQGSQVNPDMVAEADLVVIQRDFPRFWSEYKQVCDAARLDNKPVLYDLDDLLVEIPSGHSHSGDYMGELLAMLYAILDADVVTASSEHLVDYLSELNSNTSLVKNYLNDRIWKIVEPKLENETQKVMIGYMGGMTHEGDLGEIASPLLRLCEKYNQRIGLRFWGVRPPTTLLESPASEWIQMDIESYAEFARYFSRQNCDILIAPLRDNDFNRSKSSLKFLEYSALGFPGVYQNLPPYAEVVEHGVNGFLAGSAEEWEMHLSNLIEDASLRRWIGDKAQKTVVNHWLLSQNYSEWSDACRQSQFIANRISKNSLKHRNLMRIISHAEDYQSSLENSLYAVSNQLEEIRGSRSWQIIQSLQNLRLKIFPKGSKLEQILLGQKKPQ